MTFTDDKGFDELKSGDDILQENLEASGKIGVLDATAKTMTVSASTGTWATGQKVLGPNRVCPELTFNSNVSSELANFNTIKEISSRSELPHTHLIGKRISCGCGAFHWTSLPCHCDQLHK